jgi:hypothetical protein
MQVQLIDDRNRSLWESIKQQFQVIIERHPNHHFYHHLIDKEIILFVPEENPSVELFTHELLHLFLIVKGVNIKSYLKDRFRNEPLLHWSFNENLFEQIGECLEHLIMLPMYLSMGFERELFCETYFMPCCNEISMQIIRSGMMKEIPTKISLHHFIHKYFAMKACLNPSCVYDEWLDELEMFNGALFDILEKFWKEFSAFDIDNGNLHALKSSAYDLIHELGTWNILNIYAKQNIRA